MSETKKLSILKEAMCLRPLFGLLLALALASSLCQAIFELAPEVTNLRVIGYKYRDSGKNLPGSRAASLAQHAAFNSLEQHDCGRVPAMIAKIKKPSQGRAKRKRIAGGFKALKGQFPSFILLNIADSRTSEHVFCGATLLWPQIVLTAAHCLDHAVSIHAAATTYSVTSWDQMGQKSIRVKHSCKPADFATKKVANHTILASDFAILILEKPFVLDDYVQTACLPTQEIQADEVGLSVGLGLTDRYHFATDLMAIPEMMAECPNGVASPDVVCIKSSDPRYRGGTCFGDSGGPFYVTRRNRVQIAGIASFAPRFCYPDIPFVSGVSEMFKKVDQIRQLASKCLSEAKTRRG